MAIRNIVQDGDAILNKVARPVTNFDDRLAVLLDDMRETLWEADGLGLAGPQVGVLRRVFIMLDERDIQEDEDNDAESESFEEITEENEDYEPQFLEFINPEIISQEGEKMAYEGCLSFPGHNGAIKRPEKLTVRAFDRNGNPFTLELTGIMARCVCHENNHLDGITIMQLAEYFHEDLEQKEEN